MKFLLTPGKCRSFDSIEELVKNEFNRSFKDVKWEIQNDENGSTVFLKNDSDKRMLIAFKPGEGFVDIIENDLFPFNNKDNKVKGKHHGKNRNITNSKAMA